MSATPPYLALQALLLVAGVAAVLLLLPLRQPSVRRAGRVLAAVIVVAAAGGSMLYGRSYRHFVQSRTQLVSAVPMRGLDQEGFVSSNTCQSCHPHHYYTWHESYHRTMTQEATPNAVLPDLDGVKLENRGRHYTFEQRGDEFWVQMVDPEWEHQLRGEGVDPNGAPNPPLLWKRIMMTTGSHHQQTFWVGGTDGRMMYNLPFMYLEEDHRLVPREDVFMRPPNAGRGFDLWNNNCIECHAVAGESNLDPKARHADSVVAELGISCEACHGPAHEHIAANRDPTRRYKQHWSDKPDRTIVNPRRLDAVASSHVCGQCHGMNILKGPEHESGLRYRAGGDLTDVKMVLRTSDQNMREIERPDWPRLQQHISRQSDSFIEERFWPDGMVRVSGREHNAMVESACFRSEELSCLSCHSMHRSRELDDQLASGMESDEACLQCHNEHRANIAAHTHHKSGSPGSACYNCHMPHTTYGLLKAIRSHQIDSPSAQVALDTGRPDACSLCHLDQTLEFTARHLNEWYGQPMPALAPEHKETSAALLWALKGDANQRAIVAWHMGWEPARQASGRYWIGPYLAHLMCDPYAAVRYIAGRSLKQLPGFETLPYDYVGSANHWMQARAAAINQWTAQHASKLDRSGAAVLIDAKGVMNARKLDQIVSQRNDRPVDLRE